MRKISLILFAIVLATGLLMADPVSVSAQSQNDLFDMIEALEVGEPVYYEFLTIVPVYSDNTKDRTRYATLEEALRNGWLDVEEFSSGSVPRVSVSNNSGNYVFIMGGEILTGCKQDRIVSRDALIGPRSHGVTLPVYCVEQGRWSENSDRFYSKGNLGTYQMRSYAQYGRQTMQASIWAHVSEANSRMGVRSSSNAYQALYDSEPVRRKIGSYERHLGRIPDLGRGTVGVVIAVGSRIVSADVFGNTRTFKALWPKIVKSAAMSAVYDGFSGRITQEAAARYLRRLHSNYYQQRQGIDLGVDLYCADHGVNVNALTWRHSVIHMAAFTEETRAYMDYQDDWSTNNQIIRRPATSVRQVH